VTSSWSFILQSPGLCYLVCCTHSEILVTFQDMPRKYQAHNHNTEMSIFISV